MTNGQTDGWPPTAEAALDVLERFGADLQQAERAAQQIHLILRAAQEALGADAVFWHPAGDAAAEGKRGKGEEENAACSSAPLPLCPSSGSGAPRLTAAWRQAFMDHVLADLARGQGAKDRSQATRAFLDPAAKPATPWPFGAALVRVSRSRGSWLVALSFHPRRLFGPVDVRLMLLARRQLLSHRRQAQVYEKLKESLFGLVRCLTAAIDAKDPYTWGHSERVARMAVRLGRQLDLPEAVLSDLYLAGLLHDIGKIGVRDEVLRKPGRLTPEEMAHIQEHPVIGDRLVCHIKALRRLRPGVRHHHERWDGRGYPDRLAGDAVPPQARILAVADSCDAMMHTRPYRAALPTERIEQILAEGAGTQWDPHVVAAFQVCRHELYSIVQRGLGDSVSAAVEQTLKAERLADASLPGSSAPDGRRA